MAEPRRHFLIAESSLGQTRAFMVPQGFALEQGIDQYMMTRKDSIADAFFTQNTVPLLREQASMLGVVVKSKDRKMVICEKLADHLLEGLQEPAVATGDGNVATGSEVAAGDGNVATGSDIPASSDTKSDGYEVAKSDEPVEAGETWSTDDQRALDLLEYLNRGPIRVNFHELQDLLVKKARCEQNVIEMAKKNKITKRLSEVTRRGNPTVHVEMVTFDEKTFTSTCYEFIYYTSPDTTFKDVCMELIPEKVDAGCHGFMDDTCKLSLFCGHSIVSSWETVASLAVGQTVRLELRPRLAGGGNEVRKTHAKVKKSNTRIVTTAKDEPVFKNAFHCATVIGSTDKFTMDNLFNQLSLEKLDTAMEMLSGKSTSGVKVESMAELSPSWAQLEEASVMIENAKIIMKEKLAQNIVSECSTDGKFKLSELKKKVEIAIAVKKSASSTGQVAFAGADANMSG